MSRLSILYVCIGNTCRSPMAEAITRGMAGERVRVESAGLSPFGRIVDTTPATLKLLGYDPAGLRSKGLDDVDIAAFDVIVSLLGPSAHSFVPAPPTAELETWSIRDPYGEDESVYLAVARELERRIRRLLTEHLDRELPLI